MKYGIILMFTVVLFACDPKDKIQEPSDYIEFYGDKWLATEVNFMPQERYNDQQIQAPSLHLLLTSVEIFESFNFEISTTEFRKDDELIIRFDEIQIGGNFPSPGPAGGIIDLPENITKLTFINGNVVDRYTINISPEKVSISPLENTITNLLFEETFRYPVNSFAYVCGTNESDTSIYNDFLSILEQNPAFVEYEFEGAGRIPYPLSSSGAEVNHPVKYFKYFINTDFIAMGSVLDNYTLQNIPPNPGTRISLNAWNNQKHLSWD